jgi:prevent-host-death family protein
MITTNVTTLRQALPKYLSYVEAGEHIIVTSHGKPIARIIPAANAAEEAKKQLQMLRKSCKIGDVISPVDVDWDAQS